MEIKTTKEIRGLCSQILDNPDKKWVAVEELVEEFEKLWKTEHEFTYENVFKILDSLSTQNSAETKKSLHHK